MRRPFCVISDDCVYVSEVGMSKARLQGLGCTDVVEVVQRGLSSFDVELNRGSLITVKALKTTCHRLPIGISE